MHFLPIRYNLRPVKRSVILLILATILGACSSGAVDAEINRGQQVFAEHCTSCHSLADDVVIVGPSLNGVGLRAAANGDGLQPRDYLRQAIVSPQDKIVEGYNDLMPSDFARKIPSENLEALISYLMTLE